MSIVQKIIKYLAIALAIALIVGIIATIVRVVSSIPLTLKIGKNNSDSNNVIETSSNIENDNIAFLDIDIAYSNLTIRKGEHLKVESSNKDIQCKQDKKKIQIKEKDNNWFFNNNKKEELIVYVPENLQFDSVNINTGAGKVNIEILNTKVLKMDLGAGETSMKNINITDFYNVFYLALPLVGDFWYTESAKIDTGAGKVIIDSSKITDLKCDLGIGATEISAKLIGNTRIGTGVGNLKLDVVGIKEEYTTKINKGLGNVTIDKEKISDNKVVGNGENKIDIDGGVGNIKINFIGK